MKAWTTATAPGSCAFDWTHRWKAGDRVFVLQGVTWRKVYCPTCAMHRHAAPPDTGEVLDVTDAVRCPDVLKPTYEFTGVTREIPFDAKEAALPPCDRADYDDRTDDEIGTGSGNGVAERPSDVAASAAPSPTGTEEPPGADEASRALREEVGF